MVSSLGKVHTQSQADEGLAIHVSVVRHSVGACCWGRELGDAVNQPKSLVGVPRGNAF